MNTDKVVSALRAAIDETERIAREAVPGPWRFDGNPSCVVMAGDGRSLSASAWNCEPPVNAANATHIAHNDPASVLRRVEADRRVLARHTPIVDHGRWSEPEDCPDWCDGDHWRPEVCGTCRDVPGGLIEAPCDELLDLAARYGIETEETSGG